MLELQIIAALRLYGNLTNAETLRLLHTKQQTADNLLYHSTVHEPRE